MLIPSVIEQTPRGERFFDIFSRLLKERIIFIGTAIDDTVASLTIAQMLFLQGEDPGEPIQLYINSPGGSVSAGLGIYDTIQYISPPVHTWCMGLAASMAAVLLAAGEAGHRHALPHSRVLIHQPWIQSVGGQATDLKIQAEEILRTRDSLNRILSEHTSQPLERIEKDTDRDFYMSASEALEYGIVDVIATRQPTKDESTD